MTISSKYASKREMICIKISEKIAEYSCFAPSIVYSREPSVDADRLLNSLTNVSRRRPK